MRMTNFASAVSIGVLVLACGTKITSTSVTAGANIGPTIGPTIGPFALGLHLHGKQSGVSTGSRAHVQMKLHPGLQRQVVFVIADKD